MFLNRSVKLSFVKDKKLKDGEETLESGSVNLEEIQDFVVNTVAGVGLTIVTVKIVSTVCDVIKNATYPR